MKPLLKTQALEIRTAHSQLVEPLSIELLPGQVLTIIGETGSGKSLFAQGVVGNLPSGLHAEGRVEFADGFGEEARDQGRRALWGRQVAVLPQEPWLSLDPTMAALEQVTETYQHVLGQPRVKARACAREALAKVGLEKAERQFPFQLSGGMAQRLAFVAAHGGGASIMVADEPTKGLDSARIGEVVDLLKAGTEAGGALLVITHDLEVARRLGGQVMIMLKGKVIETGSAEQVLNEPSHAYTRALLAAEPAQWPRSPVRTPEGEPVIAVRDLALARGGKTLLSELSFNLHRGQILGVTGPSGCGKSTLGDALLGLIRPHSGTVTRLPGVPRITFQKLFQDPVAAFPPSVTLGRTLADLVRRHRLNPRRIAVLLKRLRLEPALLDRRPGNVSGGELQRLSLLRVLLVEPAFIFADEPSSRLDLITQREMLELLVETVRESRTALLLVSHDEALIEAVSDQRLHLGGLAQRPAEPASPAGDVPFCSPAR